MELYSAVSYSISRRITLDYSTSFGSSTKLFSKQLQPHIFAIYGLVRIADEIVDVYRGADALQVLNELEESVYVSMSRGYSANPVVHSFILTAKQFNIDQALIRPFFASMAMDTAPVDYTQERYETYIYGSAEVIGLMCLRVFLDGNDSEYERLKSGARALGAAYQKINFLRDLAADYNDLGRIYFPGVTYDSFDEDAKEHIVKDIQNDLLLANEAVTNLPPSSRKAVSLSVLYFENLLNKLDKTPATIIKQKRIRLNFLAKLALFLRANLKVGAV